MKIVPERVKDLRTSLGLTQDELGALVGIQKSGVAKYENGRITNAPTEKVGAFAAALHTTVDYLSAKLEDDLRALDIKVSYTRDGGVSVEDEMSGGCISFSADAWCGMCLDATEGFRRVWDGLNAKKLAPDTESELTPAQRKAWELLKQMDDETLDRFITAAKAFIG